MKQKDIFLESEGDKWLERNMNEVSNRTLPDDDPVIVEMLKLRLGGDRKLKVLEIGCGTGHRLQWLQINRGYECYGIDPSAKAVGVARDLGVQAEKATADNLPYGDDQFDVVIFGFCLYLCDRDDLFVIAQEADRVLKKSGWIVIRDFITPTPTARKYHHRDGVFSYKMDYSTMFTWSPNYTIATYAVGGHGGAEYSDDPQERVMACVLRKFTPVE